MQITINGKDTIIAGQDDMLVLSAGVTAVGKLGSQSEASRDIPDLFCSVAGKLRTDGAMAYWLPHHIMSVGDEICIKIIETDSPEPAVALQDHLKPKAQ